MDSDKEKQLLEEVMEYADSIPLTELTSYMRDKGLTCIELCQPCKQIRSYQYKGEAEILYLVNEGTECYTGMVSLLGRKVCGYRYDVWENSLKKLQMNATDKGTEIAVRIEPGKSWIIVLDSDVPEDLLKNSFNENRKGKKIEGTWVRSVCQSIEYPSFGQEKEIMLPDFAEKELPDFAGLLRYERDVKMDGDDLKSTMLEIEDAGEAVQVFVNGKDCGIQIVPPYRYEIGAYLHQGENHIAIEVATTLERQIPPKYGKENWMPKNHVGLCGEVFIYQSEKQGNID